MVNITAKALGNESSKIQVIDQAITGKPEEKTETTEEIANAAPEKTEAEKAEDTVTFGIGNNRAIRINGEEKNMRTRLKDAVLESLLQILLIPIQIIVYSFTAIIVALLYLKTRQAAGEPLQDLLSKFEETEHPRKKWQERVRNRLIQSGRITSRP
jgi:hypothetical protein